MRRQARSGAVRKVRVVTPGGRTVAHTKPARPDHPRCGSCGVKLNFAPLRPVERRRLALTSRRPERRFPSWCVRCSREALKLKVRGGEMERVVRGV